MMPGSGLLNWLHDVEEPVPGQLRVVAGDLQGDSLSSWLKTLVSDAFYWTDNDLVVQTRSMYGGAPRRDEAVFLLDRGSGVDHFSYFANETTADGITTALLQSAPPRGFFTIGPLAWGGVSAEGLRAGRPRRAPVSDPSTLPAVFVLPGILGTNLKADGRRIWLSWRLINGLAKLKWQGDFKVEPDGPVGSSYNDLIDHLGDTHEVIAFGYDWRKPMTEEAARLASEIEKAMTVRSGSGQPVRIVAHSMGGLLARAVHLIRPLTWQRMLAHPQSRVLMLGTPNGGSWAPMQVLSGDDTFGNALAAFGSLFDDAAARAVMAGMPGFLQLQAGLLDPALGLASESQWKQLAEDDLKQVREHNVWHHDDRQLAPYTWGVPPQSVLDQAVTLRRQFDAQVAVLQPQSDKLLLVVGKEYFTPAGFQLTDAGLEYLDAPNGGDGRVTVDSACLPGVRTWMVDAPHGKLADKASAFDAYVDLLENGTTSALTRLQVPGGRGGERQAVQVVTMPLQPSRPSRRRSGVVMPPAQPADVFTTASSPVPPADVRTAPPLVVSVINGNLRFVKQPLMLGHYRSMALTGTEAAMDHLLQGTMRESIDAGLYPDAVGAHQIFFNRWRNPEYPLRMPRPNAVIVVGLGEEGKLRSTDIAKAVRQATIAFAQRVAEAPAGADASFDLASTLIASGGTGVTPGISAQMIAQGVMEANDRLLRSGWPVVSRLDFIELFLDRAGDAWRALDIVRASDPSRFQLEEGVREGTGPLRRPLDSGYRGARYDFVTAVAQRNSQGDTLIEYSLDTRRARAEVRGQSTQSKLIRELVMIASDDRNRNQQIGRTLFHLLVPVELEPFLASSGDIVLELDPETASYPWELMDTQPDDGTTANARTDPPWAIRSRLLRKLRTETFRENPVGAGSEGGVLVIGEPVCDSKLYPPLPGARREAEAIAAVFEQQQLLLNADALAIVNTLLDSRYRIVHVSGHGEYRRSGGGGVVLSNGTVLGPREIKSMRTVPELVFVNCCFLGVIEPGGPQRSGLGRLRAAFAANVAEELIRIGVRCVVAAGWAVDDEPAMLFATHFYEQLQRGARFIDAVASARHITWTTHRQSNTWAAYQCYGDPDWTLQPGGAAAFRAPSANEGNQDIISPAGLTLALETIAIETRFNDKSPQTQLDRVHALASRYGSRWGSVGAVAEAFGRACAESGDFDGALDWYQRAVAAEDGGASMKASEQLGNLRARRAWQGLDRFKEQERRGAEWEQALREARKEMTAAGKQLRRVHDLQPTFERANLLGSAYKRLAMLEGLAGDMDAWRKTVEMTAEAYRRAGDIGEQRQLANWYYPVLNRMAATLALATAARQQHDLDAGSLERIRAAIEQHHDTDPNFWSAVQAVELSFYKAIATRQLAQDLPKLLARYDDVHARVTSPKLWQSVVDQATFALSAYKEDAVGPDEARARQELLDALKRYASE
ncbi:MAG TPA: CHAT domain-containing protein [Burkholderiaceae bacterium]|nr:CHAT domain-containing protein [Burkholderiaceae bacterium]